MAPDLARRLGLGCVDIDRRIEERFGATVAAVFEERGEPGFRTLESEMLAEALDGDPVVIATGGGIVLSAENRRRLVAESVVVWLRASPELLVARLAGATEVRPLLRGDAESALRQLSAERDALYREVAAIVVDCDDATLGRTVGSGGGTGAPRRRARRAGPRRGSVSDVPRRIEVVLGGGRTYPVIVGDGVVSGLATCSRPRRAASAVVTQSGIPVTVDPGIEHRTFTIGDGESAKTLVDRRDAVLGVGGLGAHPRRLRRRRRRWARDRRRRLRGISVPPGRAGDPRGDDVVGPDRRRHRRQDRREPSAGQEPGRARSGSRRRSSATCRSSPRSRPGRWPVAWVSSPSTTGWVASHLDELDLVDRVARCVQIKADVVASDERETGRPRPAELRPHAGPRDRDRQRSPPPPR